MGTLHLPIPSPHLASQLTWVLSLGESTTTVSPFVPGGVSDGQWHTVQLKYYNKVGVGGVRELAGPALGSGAHPDLGGSASRGRVMACLPEREGGVGVCHLAGAFPFQWVVPDAPCSVTLAKRKWTLL